MNCHKMFFFLFFFLLFFLSGILLVTACHTEVPPSEKQLTLWSTDTLSNHSVQIVSNEMAIDSLVLSGPLEMRFDENGTAGTNRLPWILLSVGLAFLAAMGGFWYKRKSYRERIASLAKENIETHQMLTRHRNEVCRKRRQSFELSLGDSSIYKEIQLLVKENRDKVHSHELLSTRQWQELYAAIDSRADNFSQRLSQQFTELKPEDIRFCCLLKIGLKYPEIACLMGRTSNMMYKRRAIIVHRMALPEDQLPLEEYMRNL